MSLCRSQFHENADEIRAEVLAKAERLNVPTIDDRVLKLLSCGHSEPVAPGLNPEHAVCSQCRQKSMLFTPHK